ncbi:MAG: 4-alpha-glucanotransferase [Acidobacteriia bacterium]|nr:4-alpha-glucanotransferase [Terriglobia bacterium]
MPFERASGILLHPTSLPSAGGIGDLGPAAYGFVDFLAKAKQGLWQVLPLSPTGYGNSPYSSTSAFAGNPLLISLERLAERGWIEAQRLSALDERQPRAAVPHKPVEYERVRAAKMPLLREAARNFLRQGRDADRQRFERWHQENIWWLDDYVFFEALRERYQNASWNTWPRELAQRDPAALDRTGRELAEELAMRRVIQFAFYEQWRALHHYCREKGIKIIGDVAIFVSYDSADVWTHPELFQLDEERNPYVVAGVPPDAFSTTGQRWGNPLYRWDVLRQRGYEWWIQRMRWATRTCDIVRLDHFRGFEAYWEIPASEPTAVHGRWVKGPNDDLFTALRNALGDLPFIAEDLGFITPEVHALRERLRIPGMRVMQFAFGNKGAHIYLPQNFVPNCVVYTGTHDNDTTAGWWASSATEHEKHDVRAYLGESSDGVHWDFIRAAIGSVADLCVIPLQDVLGLGSEARMNVPSKPDGNWSWRYKPGALTPALAERLATLVEVSDRDRGLAARQQRSGEAGEEFVA